MNPPDIDKLHAILKAIRGRKILVYGDLMIDEFLYGIVGRISPEAPVPVLEIKSREYLLGGAANAALNIVTLGADCTIVGCVGNDDEGKMLHSLAVEHGITDIELMIADDRPTTKKTRVVAHSQHVIRIDSETTEPVNKTIERGLIELLDTNLDGSDGVLICNYDKGAVTPAAARWLIAECARRDTPVLLDSKSTDTSAFMGVTMLTPNIGEAQALTGIKGNDEAAFAQMGTKLLQQFKAKNVVITRAEAGMTVYSREREPFSVPAFSAEVRDVTGAGDTVAASFILSLAADLPMDDATFFANAAAASVVRKVGTAAPLISDMEEILVHYHG